MKPKFVLGQVVATRNLLDKMAENLEYIEIAKALARHQLGDWGEVCDEDKAQNNAALSETEPGRLMSVYTSKNGIKFWIITEWDRSITTILLPEDY